MCEALATEHTPHKHFVLSPLFPASLAHCRKSLTFSEAPFLLHKTGSKPRLPHPVTIQTLGRTAVCPITPGPRSLPEPTLVPGSPGKRARATPTWMVLVSFRAGVTVPMGGLTKVAGGFRFKLIFSRASATGRGFWGAALCCLREFSISLASCTFPLIRNRASFCKSFSRASFTPSLSRASARPIFCRASNLCWKVAVRAGWLRRLCWIPTRDRTPPTPGLAWRLQEKIAVLSRSG